VKFVDYSPPHSPSLDQQRSALQKGLGRAMQWAMYGCLDDEPLLDACLRDQRFDQQVDSPRGDWLWQVIQARKATDRFRVPILHALCELADEPSAHQLCQLARHYAGIENGAFRTRMYEIVEQKLFADNAWPGEEELVRLDSEQGFLFAARVRGELLKGREWVWDDGGLIDLANTCLGEDRVRCLLDASADQAIQRFRKSWQREKEKKTQGTTPESHRNRMRSATIEEVLRAAEGESIAGWLRGWGMNASETDLQTVLQHLWAAHDPHVIANLLRVFSARALPEFDDRLIELCRHSNESIQLRALRALRENAHPRVRRYAIAEAAKGLRSGSVVALFIKNYQHGDEHRILDALELPEDTGELHWVMMEVSKVLEENPEADCSQWGVVCYALTPCESCRFATVRLLFDRHAAPEWLADECRYDSCADCRELAEGVGSIGRP
jgi:hypothetical protein